MQQRPDTLDFATISIPDADAFCESEDGAILPIIGVSLAVFLGLVALSFDLGRLASTQSELQSFADHVALAAAGELDGEAGAIGRAEVAASELIRDAEFRQTFGTGAQALESANVALSFHATLPDSDLDPMTPETLSDGAAGYVRATVAPETVRYTFARAFNALTGRDGPNEGTVGAVAVAGFTSYVCDITPMMFCVPPADPANGVPPFDADARIGDMIHLRAGGGGSQWGAGNWGWLRIGDDVAAAPTSPCYGINSDIQRTLCLLGTSAARSGCYRSDGRVDLGPGQNVGSFEAAINVRFDRYASTMNQQRTSPNFGPAPNVIQGRTAPGGQGGGQCTYGAANDTVALPRDACFGAGTCGRFGDGVYDLTEYITTNYDTAPEWYVNEATRPSTRFGVYLAEIAAAGNPDQPILASRSESGRAVCSQHASSDPNRRVIIAAGIDCEANNIQGAATGIPVMQYVRLFITEPVPGGPDRDLFVEIIGGAGGTGDAQSEAGIIREVVQLYR